MSATGVVVLPATAPVGRRVRAYFAPVTRVAGSTTVPAVWDPALMGALSLDAMPTPWVDLGAITGFVRRSETTVEALRAGSPAAARRQVRTGVAAEVEFAFDRWGKLQLALSCGVQQMNLLAPAAGAAAAASGAKAGSATPLAGGAGLPPQTATVLQVGAAAAAFTAGQMVAVDVDYTGQTGYVGSGASGAYVASSMSVQGDVNYVRRVTLNVGVIASVSGGALLLANPLLAGVPTAAMSVSPVLGFVDREGGGFFQEWSALFVIAGEQGDRLCYHYPRLQAVHGPGEMADGLEGTTGALQRMRLKSVYRSLATTDSTDGEAVLCYRSYLPAAMRAV